jgi:CRISPR-associated endoribonuclease Cas6
LALVKAAFVPMNHQHLLCGVVSNFLGKSRTSYAGAVTSQDASDEPRAPGTSHRYRHYTFSLLRARRRRVDADTLRVEPGTIEWLVSASSDAFLEDLAQFLLESRVMRIGDLELPVTGATLAPVPVLPAHGKFTCLSPIVAAVNARSADPPTVRYLQPRDAGFSACVRSRLIAKHLEVHGAPPTDTEFSLEFDTAYLDRSPGTKLIVLRGNRVLGAFAPFTIDGSPELIRTAYDCGLGTQNASGFGMIEVVTRPDHSEPRL